ncbi:hypothetical protein R5R35_003742 [Gryllus longicercus]|uniref:Uncharacterized protein n=1 Tax=Gryllus longicercus TaxID=2509291 RepID=A0AAN9ZAW5_9ORTH
MLLLEMYYSVFVELHLWKN